MDECIVILNVSMFGILLSKLLWPCLAFLSFDIYIYCLVSVFLFTVCLHMSKWKCWYYLCYNRQRLPSLKRSDRNIKYKKISLAILSLWSIYYGIISYSIKTCHTPWWPSVVIVACILCYTASGCSTGCSFGCFSSSESSNVNLEESGVVLSYFSSKDISSSDDE